MTNIIEPVTVNIINAVMFGLMGFGLLFTPKKFMQGGQYQNPWFKNLPANSDHRLYYIGQFMGFLMLGGCVVPTLIQPDSQLICYQMSIVHGLSLIHLLIFLCSPVYKEAVPEQLNSRVQWGFSFVLNIALFIVSVLASTHSVPDVIDSGETYITKFTANIAMLCFSSFFGILFIVAPKYLLSGFWSDETQQGGNDLCGFKILYVLDHELWWARCVGIVILALNLGIAADTNVEHPLYTIGSLVIVSCLTLHNFHQVIMRPYSSISSYQILVSWIPNILMSLAMCGVLASALLYK